MACNCNQTELQSVDETTCPFNINQILRNWFYQTGGVIFDIVTPANNFPASIAGLSPLDEATWDILKLETGISKVVPLPLFGGDPVVEAGEQKTFGGGDNSTRVGVRNNTGFDPSTFSARFDSLTGAQEEQIDDLTCYKEKLQVFMIPQDATIMGSRDGDLFTGFQLASAPALLGRAVNGFGQDDSNRFEYQLDKKWSYKAEKQTPNFNPLLY